MRPRKFVSLVLTLIGVAAALGKVLAATARATTAPPRSSASVNALPDLVKVLVDTSAAAGGLTAQRICALTLPAGDGIFASTKDMSDSRGRYAGHFTI